MKPESILRCGLALALFIVIPSCGGRKDGNPRSDIRQEETAKSGMAIPEYDVVFPEDSVNTIEILMEPSNWKRLEREMREMTGVGFGEFKSGPPLGNLSENPDYVGVKMTFRGRTWENIGFRFKGDGSLRKAWHDGIYKMPFRLKFDEYKAENPEASKRDFHGFKELSFSAATDDPSLIREKTASEVFRLAGVACAKTSFYRVFIDKGQGLQYFGMYTAVESPDDRMLMDRFGEESGSLYKPESNLKTFLPCLFNKKKTKGGGKSEHSDIRRLVTTLNSPLRQTDYAKWRKEISKLLDVDYYLKYLAANNAMVNWDSYGKVPHNYYLYKHSQRGFIWIPWDHDKSLTGNPSAFGDTNIVKQSPLTTGLTLGMQEVRSNWPLIRYILDDQKWNHRYSEHMAYLLMEVFTEEKIHPILEKNHGMIRPFVVGPKGEKDGYTHLKDSAQFSKELMYLKDHIASRRRVMEEFLR